MKRSLFSIVLLLAALCLVISPLKAARIVDSINQNPPAINGYWRGSFESDAFKIAMDLSVAGKVSQPTATIKFSEGTREETLTLRELKIQDQRISFGVLLDGMELKFSGALAGDSLGGDAEGFRDSVKIGTGKWNLTRVTAPTTQPDNDVLQSANNDTAAIKLVIQRYLDVTEKKDSEAIKLAFHTDTKLLSVGKNGLNQMTLDEWWGRISRIPGKVERKSEITILDISGLAAIVKVDFGASKDYVSLLKINGEWKIVNKILSTSLN
ncbi:MAG TPA: nuclear transport factor 2 family protein [Blastocatellia bacterium]|nr:nuclear transport factor 2 family protein [Blastocatellia bacterium]